MNVVSLRGTPLPSPSDPDPDVVKLLKNLLVKARAGQIHGIAVVCAVDGVVSTGWAGSANAHDMLSGATYLQWRMAKDFEAPET